MPRAGGRRPGREGTCLAAIGGDADWRPGTQHARITSRRPRRTVRPGVQQGRDLDRAGVEHRALPAGQGAQRGLDAFQHGGLLVVQVAADNLAASAVAGVLRTAISPMAAFTYLAAWDPARPRRAGTGRPDTRRFPNSRPQPHARLSTTLGFPMRVLQFG